VSSIRKIIRVLKLTSEVLKKTSVWKYEECAYAPVLKPSDIPSDVNDLRISAAFKTPLGLALHGYVIATLFAIGIVIDDNEFIFNHNLPELAKEELRNMKIRLRGKMAPEDDIFPLDISVQALNLSGMFDFR